MQLKEHEQIDDLQYKGIKIIQDDKMFRFGTDAVLLAGFAEAWPRETVVDFCTGTGIIPLLLTARTGAKVVGIEIQERAAELAQRSVALNGLEEKIQIIPGDIKEARRLIKGHVHAVTCNPPYERLGAGGISASEEIRIARHEVMCDLEAAVKSASELLQTGGRLYMIHRISRMAELIYIMKRYRIEPKVVRIVQSEAEKPPILVLVKGVKDANPDCIVPRPLVIQDRDGNYTEEMNQIYHRSSHE